MTPPASKPEEIPPSTTVVPMATPSPSETAATPIIHETPTASKRTLQRIKKSFREQMQKRGAFYKVSRKLSPQEAAKKADAASLSIRKLKGLRPPSWPLLAEISSARKEAESFCQNGPSAGTSAGKAVYTFPISNVRGKTKILRFLFSN